MEAGPRSGTTQLETRRTSNSAWCSLIHERLGRDQLALGVVSEPEPGPRPEAGVVALADGADVARCRLPNGEVSVTARCGFRNDSSDEDLADFLTTPAGSDDRFRLPVRPGSNTPVSPTTEPANSATQDAIGSGVAR
jgi:hypothetical protein